MVDMMKIQEELEKFGLSKNQAEIYVLLVSRGELRVQEIVDLTKLPRSTIYENLKGLFEFGIAEESVENSFKKIRPYPISAIKHGLEEKMLHLQKLKVDLKELEKTLELKIPNGSFGSTAVRCYRGRSGARQIFWNSLKADSVVYIYSDWSRRRYVGMKFYENFVVESRERKVQEKVLINLNKDTKESIKKYTYPGSPISRTMIEDIRVIDKENTLIKGDTLIYDDTFAHVNLNNMEINGFEIESGQFTDTQRSIFGTLWQQATPIQGLL
jgi:sugar-specific transcriptional regulator TrmB